MSNKKKDSETNKLKVWTKKMDEYYSTVSDQKFLADLRVIGFKARKKKQ